MKQLVRKELSFTSLKLSYFFILFGFMTMIPGYPILIGAFFLTLGIFQSFENARLQNDIIYSLLLPAAKRDIVKAKYIYVLIVEGSYFVLASILTAIRMVFLSNSQIYAQNVMMNANLAYLGYILIIFALFNIIFVNGFFKTAYYVGKPFLLYGLASFAAVFIAEAIHHFPGMNFLNSQSEGLDVQSAVLLCSIALFAASSFLAAKKSAKAFEELDI